MAEKKKQGAKGRKIGRNKKQCEVYALLDRRLQNKIRKLRRHLNRKKGSKRKKTQVLRHQNDQQAKSALKRLTA